MQAIKKIGVAGAGAMGAGIAQVFAQAGFEVVLFDVNADQIQKAKADITRNLEGAIAKGKLKETDKSLTLERITFSNDIQSLKADLIIEAIMEQLEGKRELFKKLATFNSTETI